MIAFFIGDMKKNIWDYFKRLTIHFNFTSELINNFAFSIYLLLFMMNLSSHLFYTLVYIWNKKKLYMDILNGWIFWYIIHLENETQVEEVKHDLDDLESFVEPIISKISNKESGTKWFNFIYLYIYRSLLFVLSWARKNWIYKLYMKYIGDNLVTINVL